MLPMIRASRADGHSVAGSFLSLEQGSDRHASADFIRLFTIIEKLDEGEGKFNGSACAPAGHQITVNHDRISGKLRQGYGVSKVRVAGEAFFPKQTMRMEDNGGGGADRPIQPSLLRLGLQHGNQIRCVPKMFGPRYAPGKGYEVKDVEGAMAEKAIGHELHPP
jgi:hypothetical protein